MKYISRLALAMGLELTGCLEGPKTEKVVLQPPELFCDSEIRTLGDITFSRDPEERSTNPGLENYPLLLGQLGFLDIDFDTGIRSTAEGFEFYKDHKGETGGTLQLLTCNNSVHLTWLGGSLSIIATRNPSMVTDTGFRVGNSLEAFLRAYPNAVQKVVLEIPNATDNVWTSKHLKVGFAENNISYALELSTTDYDDEANDLVFPPGPNEWWR